MVGVDESDVRSSWVMKPTEPVSSSPSREQQHIYLFFDSEEDYKVCVADLSKYPAFLLKQKQQNPELFPQAFAASFSFHDYYSSHKQKDLVLRRIRHNRVEGSFHCAHPSSVPT